MLAGLVHRASVSCEVSCGSIWATSCCEHRTYCSSSRALRFARAYALECLEGGEWSEGLEQEEVVIKFSCGCVYVLGAPGGFKRCQAHKYTEILKLEKLLSTREVVAYEEALRKDAERVVG